MAVPSGMYINLVNGTTVHGWQNRTFESTCIFFFPLVVAVLEKEGQGATDTWKVHEDRIQDFL